MGLNIMVPLWEYWLLCVVCASRCPTLERSGKMPLWIREAICLKYSQPHIEIHTKVPLATNLSDISSKRWWKNERLAKLRAVVILMLVVCCRNCGLKLTINSKVQLADKSSPVDLEIKLRNPQQIQKFCTFFSHVLVVQLWRTNCPLCYKAVGYVVTKNMFNALQNLALSCQLGVNNMFMSKTFLLSSWEPFAAKATKKCN